MQHRQRCPEAMAMRRLTKAVVKKSGTTEKECLRHGLICVSWIHPAHTIHGKIGVFKTSEHWTYTVWL